MELTSAIIVSFLADLDIPFYLAADQLGIPLEKRDPGLYAMIQVEY
jgi:hypothetical protein